MAQEVRELQVRALDGRSTAVTLAAAVSVRDLKAALRSSFPPAQISHNFHLFLKGAKLRLDAKIDSLVVSQGEFIVLVPFTRKSAQSSPVATPGEEQSANPPISPEVAAEANSAWQDIMDDLSSIPSSPNADAASKELCSGSYAEDVSTGKSPSTRHSMKKRKIFKENGSSSRDTSGVDSASEQPSMNKKNGFVKSAASSCHDKHPLGPAEMVEHLKKGLGKEGQIVHIEEIPCRGASYAELPPHLSETMREALQSIGISRLYSHQALAQDQLRTLLEMKKAFNTDIDGNIYDGDTPREDRLWIRDNARLDRRKIEADLFEGKLRGVAATNALELGIDVGHIDATLHLGFPGSVASLWQQAGRSGRRAKQSLAIYVAFEGPLDQYFMKSPHKLFGRPIEHCQVDSHNPKVLEQHLACAAYEHPICLQYDEDHFGSSLDSIMTTLKEKGYLINNPPGPFSSTMWNYIGPEKRPSQTVSIRAIEHDKYSVIDKLNNRLLEEIEESKAFFQVYEGAIYMHQGVHYLVEELDLKSRTAFCRKADAVWIRIPQSAKISVEERKLEFRGGSHAASHAILNILPLHMMCSSSDLGTECVNPHETRGMPERILLYDKHPGGIGIASKVKMLFGELLLAALKLVSTCSCTSVAGCPNCIQSLTCSEYNGVLDKEAAILIMKV
ncbi:hypothetical protein ACQ4PT_056753 [Festuca glaucescens]